ncbi:MAG: hypothetical protein DRJ42_18470 [Deltaproteobacteria bacterium]|nr:MAG: hypothetical protein DRJ42_18470 [Deltaproteobacteria bacterium]
MKPFVVLSLLTGLLLSAACDGGSSSSVDGGGGTSVLGGNLDPAVLEACRDAAGLSFGRCIDDVGAPCTGGEVGTAAFFEAFSADAQLTPVIGPQGSAMFALSVRVSGIDPGDPEAVFSPDNPVLEIDLLDETGTEVVAAYRGRSGFRAVDGMDGTHENTQVFVIVDHSISTIRGEHLRLDALLTDSAMEHRCGSLAFQAGAE